MHGCNSSPPYVKLKPVQIKVVVYLEKLFDCHYIIRYLTCTYAVVCFMHSRFPERQLFSIQFFNNYITWNSFRYYNNFYLYPKL